MMTQDNARQACKLLGNNGWRETEVVRYEHSWRVYATDKVSGYRIHFDDYDLVIDRVIDRA